VLILWESGSCVILCNLACIYVWGGDFYGIGEKFMYLGYYGQVWLVVSLRTARLYAR